MGNLPKPTARAQIHRFSAILSGEWVGIIRGSPACRYPAVIINGIAASGAYPTLPDSQVLAAYFAGFHFRFIDLGRIFVMETSSTS
jgi:hypothetical protein